MRDFGRDFATILRCGLGTGGDCLHPMDGREAV
jgi:hypothetical protein